MIKGISSPSLKARESWSFVENLLSTQKPEFVASLLNTSVA